MISEASHLHPEAEHRRPALLKGADLAVGRARANMLASGLANRRSNFCQNNDSGASSRRTHLQRDLISPWPGTQPLNGDRTLSDVLSATAWRQLQF